MNAAMAQGGHLFQTGEPGSTPGRRSLYWFDGVRIREMRYRGWRGRAETKADGAKGIKRESGEKSAK